MSTSRLNKKGSVQNSRQDSSERHELLGLDTSHPHVQSHDLIIEQDNPIELVNQVGSDGDDLRSPRHGVNTNNSNDSVPVRSAQDVSASQQSYNYDFLYDPEVARQGANGSAASVKLSSSNHSAAAHSALSPHVFMLSTDGNDYRALKSATPEHAGGSGGGLHKTSINSAFSRGSSGNHQASNAVVGAQARIRNSEASEKNVTPRTDPNQS